jgi:hypothetical protein
MDITGWTDLERRYISEHRWWTAAEIAATAETVYPDGLADLLTGLLAATSEGA